VSAVAAIRPAARDVLFATERNDAVPAVSGASVNFDAVFKYNRFHVGEVIRYLLLVIWERE